MGAFENVNRSELGCHTRCLLPHHQGSKTRTIISSFPLARRPSESSDALVAPASSSASSLVRSQKKEKPFFAECVRRIVDGSDNTGKYSRWHRPSICFSSSINWGKRGPHFRNDSLFGEEERKHKNFRDAPHLYNQTNVHPPLRRRARLFSAISRIRDDQIQRQCAKQTNFIPSHLPRSPMHSFVRSSSSSFPRAGRREFRSDNCRVVWNKSLQSRGSKRAGLIAFDLPRDSSRRASRVPELR